uniref:Peptidase A1 domain-containing protein n=1 Tax=Nelumbo nucifera TaxID=4432 RepID=A0A822ZU34_NELNU|nr:TPA_asm: hypothetical protein HUJ06_018017 [Nelumbo nucifera]
MTHGDEARKKESVRQSTHRDLTRIQTLFRRITERMNQNMVSRLTEKKLVGLKPMVAPAAASESDTSESARRLVETLESGFNLGSGEQFMDVFVGTPPKHFSLILDIGSDLNWI